MRIAYFNWVDHDDRNQVGGGVTVYQKNLAASMPPEDTFFIFSGFNYDLKFPTPHWVRKGQKYFIYNSGTVGPAANSSGQEVQFTHAPTTNTFIDALTNIGELDVLHFNNLEGLPLNTLYVIKQAFPKIKIVYSVHNYYAVCPRVNLWQMDTVNCTDFADGQSCVSCVQPKRPYGWYEHEFYRRELYEKYAPSGNKLLRSLIKRFAKLAWRGKRRMKAPSYNEIRDPYEMDQSIDRPLDLIDAPSFAERRVRFVKTLNECCSIILPVSQRVREICVSHGISPRLLKTSYIGTSHHHHFDPEKRIARSVETITYLGYMRKFKGFYFFLETMQQLPDELASKLKLIIAAKNSNPQAVREIKALSSKFKEVVYLDGYTSETLPAILKKSDLTVVPVLWEDNLPQVAIESNCYNVPVLASDMGGPAEVTGHNSDFTFKAGSYHDLVAKLSKIVENGVTVDGYWNGTMRPISMEQHCEELRKIYRQLMNGEEILMDPVAISQMPTGHS